MTFSEFAAMDYPTESAKRIKEAAKAKFTPVPGTLDVVNSSGVIKGDHGTYQVTLESCPCGDFRKRHFPCKHMYRLAYELGAFVIDNVKTDESKIVSHTLSERNGILSSSKEKLADCPVEQINFLNKTLYAYLFRKEEYPIVTSDLSAFQYLVSNGFVAEEKSSDVIITRLGKKRVSECLDNIGYPFTKACKTQKAKYEFCLSNADEIAKLIDSYHVLKLTEEVASVSKKLYEYTNSVLRSKDEQNEASVFTVPVLFDVDVSSGRLLVDNLEEYVVKHIEQYMKELLQESSSKKNDIDLEETPDSESSFPVYAFASIDDLEVQLQSIGMHYVDKRAKDGNFWIPAGSLFDDIISRIEVNGVRFKYSESVRTFDRKPGWYIK